MHLLTTSSATLDEMIEPIDLGQPPGDIVVLSFADSDLAALSNAWTLERNALPSVRFANLRDLRHPMSVDLWIERVGAHAKVILVRLLGGLDWWRYGVEQLSSVARERGIALALLPGEDRDDPRLAEYSTLVSAELGFLLRFFREGGRDNLRSLLRRLASHAGCPLEAAEPQPIPRHTAYAPGHGPIELEEFAKHLPQGAPVVPVVFYRSMLLAGDTAPIDALCDALAKRGMAPVPLVITSFKDPACADFIRDALVRLNPALVITTTAFAAAGEPGQTTPLELPGVPVLQAIIATTKRAAWQDSPRGLGSSDLAMHVVLPELDGRILAGALAFKDPLPLAQELAFTALANRPEPDRIEMVAERAAAWIKLQATPRAERKLAIVMPNYPGVASRTGYAVGLDVPGSVLAVLDELAEAGYRIADRPEHTRILLDRLSVGADAPSLALAQYKEFLTRLPAELTARIHDAWGNPEDDPDVYEGAFKFQARWFGHVLVALPPDRGTVSDRRRDYHNPALPPRHALLAFGLWLRHAAKIDALVHMGAHGTIEWLPGKAVALSKTCFPEAILGSLPVCYPFIVSNPGEAAQAKRRIAAVTIGHLPPPLVNTQLSNDLRDLERLVDEYAQADGLDRRRREKLARLIVESADRSGLAREAGVTSSTEPDDALRAIDAWLCDLKDLAIKDGLHIYGRPPQSNAADPSWGASAEAERVALIAALDGKLVLPGPAGAPARGRRDVLPTGRNLFTADPRTLPTPTALDLGRLASDEVVRAYLQQHGEMPRSIVIDLWGSATLRTGGEEIAQGLALMGCRPLWDHATGRVTGIEVLPTAAFGRPRIDVTWRISGLFRDLFSTQIALLDAAVQAVAAREETAEDNPLRASALQIDGNAPIRAARIFGTAPGAYGSGIEHLLGETADHDTLGAAYLSASSYAFGGGQGEGTKMPGAFADRVAQADVLLHVSDNPDRDLLEGSADVAFVGGFAAAAKMLARAPDLVMLDATDPARPRARSLASALARIVRGRATSPRFIAGQMRHGPRGAAEFAETVDRLVAFAETTGAVSNELFDLVHDAYLGDFNVREFMLRENPAAAREVAERLDAARRHGLWHPRRNDIEVSLAAAMGAAP